MLTLMPEEVWKSGALQLLSQKSTGTFTLYVPQHNYSTMLEFSELFTKIQMFVQADWMAACLILYTCGNATEFKD